jgi:hypothetical protein
MTYVIVCLYIAFLQIINNKKNFFGKEVKIKMKNIFVALMTIALVIAPAAANAETITNSGNGVESNNTAVINQTNTTTVSQTNAAQISNNLSVKSNTGGNDANSNTGGAVNVSTGDSGVKTSVENFANQNVAKVDSCCATAGATTIGNSGNGDSSDNKAKVNNTNTTTLQQQNVAEIANVVDVFSNTGKNEANRNTGSGLDAGVSVSTGDSLVGPIKITNQANSNMAQVGSPAGHTAGAGLTLGNVGNGVDTDNSAVANFSNTTAATQLNDAYVLNYVDVHSNTGKNDANRNTGGEVNVDTGDSAIAVALGTNVNSNAAWLDNCGCVGLGESTVLNKGNGDSADSKAVLNKYNTTAAAQANLSDVANVGYFDSNTGYNDANSNTGAVYGFSDPAISTGVGYTNVAASTAANQNMLNSGNVAMPTPPSSTGAGNGSWWYWMGYSWNAAY